MEQFRLLERLGQNLLGNEIQIPKANNLDDDDGISVEEGLDTRRNYLRYFSLQNPGNRFNIIISKSASILGCLLDGREIVVDTRLYHEQHETGAISDRLMQKVSSLQWNCHVRGKELILSAPNGSSNISYSLSPQSQLTSKVKLKSIHLQHQVMYFNLKTATERSDIDGHFLQVYTNSHLNSIQNQHTRLLCQCNTRSTILPESLISQPYLLQRNSTVNLHQEGQVKIEDCIREDDVIVCDAIFSLQTTQPSEVLGVKLSFAQRELNITVQSAQQASTSSENSSRVNNTGNGHNNTSNLRHSIVTATSSSGTGSTASATTPGGDCDVENTINLQQQQQALGGSNQDTTSNSEASASQQAQQSSSNNSGAKASTTTVLRVRVRITNYGICILPHMMTNYLCKYKFAW